jgi:hypothetical protein
MTPPYHALYPQETETQAECSVADSITDASGNVTDEKHCSRCEKRKSVDDFHKNKKSKDGLALWCKDCVNAYSRSWSEERTERFKAVEGSSSCIGVLTESEILKICTKCKIPQHLIDFEINPGGRGGRRAQCKKCRSASKRKYYQENKEAILAKARVSGTHKETMRKWREKNAEYARQKHEKWLAERPGYNRIHGRIHGFKNYRVDENWYNTTLAAQGGGCAICGTKESGISGKRFHIDHNHNCCPPEKGCDLCRRGILCNRCNLKLGIIENEVWAKQAKAYLAKYKRTDESGNQQPSLFD